MLCCALVRLRATGFGLTLLPRHGYSNCRCRLHHAPHRPPLEYRTGNDGSASTCGRTTPRLP
eukprot:5360560-Lingulodinium_polyedra.AAC.1